MTISGVKKLWHASKSIIKAKLAKRVKSKEGNSDNQNIETDNNESVIIDD